MFETAIKYPNTPENFHYCLNMFGCSYSHDLVDREILLRRINLGFTGGYCDFKISVGFLQIYEVFLPHLLKDRACSIANWGISIKRSIMVLEAYIIWLARNTAEYLVGMRYFLVSSLPNWRTL